MKSGLDFYKKDTAYRIMEKELAARYGKQKTERIWKRAGRYLERLYEKFDDVPKAQRMHTHNEIFPRIAMYRALQKELPEEAMDIMDWAVEYTGKKAGKILGTLTAIPGMQGVFMHIFAWMTRKMFGPAAGFEHTFHHTDKNELRFDITSCPYCKYCKICGCSELTHTFCDSDVYCYGNLSKIRFERTQTLGTGGKKCDFRLKREK